MYVDVMCSSENTRRFSTSGSSANGEFSTAPGAFQTSYGRSPLKSDDLNSKQHRLYDL